MTQDGLNFMKMHGLGNDFVVLDAREGVVLDAREGGMLDAREGGMLDAREGGMLDMPPGLARALADRHFGVGCDQIAVIAPAADADAALIFYNADGSLSATCGNATRCIAAWLMEQTGQDRLRFQTRDRVVSAQRENGGVAVNLGQPEFDWRHIPLAEAVDHSALPLEGQPFALSMGNPHCVFFVDDLDPAVLEQLGPRIEHHPLYPERTNVELVQVLGRDRIRVLVWERGAGRTLASGSCASASVVAAASRGLTDRAVTVALEGGALSIDWREDGVWMAGPVAHVFNGTLTPAWLAEALA